MGAAGTHGDAGTGTSPDGDRDDDHDDDEVVLWSPQYHFVVKIEIPASVQEGGWSEPWRLETGEREREVRRRRRRRRRQQDRNKTGNGQSVDEVPGVGCCPFG
jgi:hypothetical protein